MSSKFVTSSPLTHIIITIIICYYVHGLKTALIDSNPQLPPSGKTVETPNENDDISPEPGKWTAENCHQPSDSNMKHEVKNSKYFVNFNRSSFKQYSSQEVINSCKDHGLTALEIRHYDDYLSIQDHFRKLKGLGKTNYVPQGISDDWDGPDSNAANGLWRYSNGDELTFSAWFSNVPANKNNSARCSDVGLNARAGDHLYWNDMRCYQTVFWAHYAQICQFPKSHICYGTSAEEKSNEDRNNSLYFVGETETRNFYSTYLQKPRDHAYKFCLKNGYSLFDFAEYSNDEIMEEMYEMHLKNLKKLDVGEWTYFWTSATLEKSKNPKDGWTWQSTGEKYEYPPTDQSRKVQLVIEKASDSENRPDGTCLAYSFIESNKIHKINVRPYKCEAPFFFYCYEEKNKTEPSGETESTPSPSEPLEPSGETESTPSPSEPLEPSGETDATTSPSEPLGPEGETEAIISPSEPLEPSGETEATSLPSEPLEPSGETEATTSPLEPLEPSGETEATTSPSEPLEPSGETEATISPSEPLEPSGETEATISPSEPLETTDETEATTSPSEPSGETEATTSSSEPLEPEGETEAKTLPFEQPKELHGSPK